MTNKEIALRAAMDALNGQEEARVHEASYCLDSLTDGLPDAQIKEIVALLPDACDKVNAFFQDYIKGENHV